MEFCLSYCKNLTTGNQVGSNSGKRIQMNNDNVFYIIKSAIISVPSNTRQRSFRTILHSRQSQFIIIIIIYWLAEQIQICSRRTNIAGATRLRISTNSRPKGNITKKYKHEKRIKRIQENMRATLSTQALNAIPVCRERLRVIKKVTKIDTFNCTLECGE